LDDVEAIVGRLFGVKDGETARENQPEMELEVDAGVRRWMCGAEGSEYEVLGLTALYLLTLYESA